MPDPNPSIHHMLAQQRQATEFAAQIEDVWRIMLMVGAGLLVVMAVAAIILAVWWASERQWRTPPAPKSIIPPQPDGRSRYNAKGKQRR